MRRVQAEHFNAPGDFVGDALAERLARRPKFKIPKAIVRSVPVLVMNVFVVAKWSTDVPRHYQTMLKNLSVASGVGVASGPHLLISIDRRVPGAHNSKRLRQFASTLPALPPSVVAIAVAARPVLGSTARNRARRHRLPFVLSNCTADLWILAVAKIPVLPSVRVVDGAQFPSNHRSCASGLRAGTHTRMVTPH